MLDCEPFDGILIYDPIRAKLAPPPNVYEWGKKSGIVGDTALLLIDVTSESRSECRQARMILMT